MSKEEMYEEEDDLPSFYRYAGNLPFPPRFKAYATLHSGLHKISAADANHQRVHSAFAQAFPHLNGNPQQTIFAQPPQSPMPLMSGSPANIDTTFNTSQPVSPSTAMINPASPAPMRQTNPFSPRTLTSHVPSPMPSVHSPMVTPPADPHSPHGFFGGSPFASSPMSQVNGVFPDVSPSSMHIPIQRSMSLSASSERRSSPKERGPVPQAFRQQWGLLDTPDLWTSTEMGSYSMCFFDDDNSEPPPKRRRSQPTLHNHRYHTHTPPLPLSNHRHSPQKNPTFTSKPPGSLQTLYHKSDGKDNITRVPSPPFFRQQSIVLQSPPPPKSRHPDALRVQTSLDSPTRPASTDTPTILEEEKVLEQKEGNNFGSMGGHLTPDTGFAFDTVPTAHELLMDQNGNFHDDFELSRMLEQPTTFQFDSLTNEGADEPFENWEDMLNIPSSQLDNEDEI